MDKKIKSTWAYCWINIDTEDKQKLLAIITEWQKNYFEKCNEAERVKEELDEIYRNFAHLFMAQSKKSFIQKLFQ